MCVTKKRILSLLLTLCMVIGLMPSTIFASGSAKETAVEVPSEALVIESGTYYGISRTWFEENNPGKETMSLSLKMPNSVTTICKDGLRDSWSSEKQQKGCITNYNYDGDKTYTDKYKIINIDFSSAENLTTIGEQAAMGIPLEGVLDLSNTKVETIGKNAFKECTGITGVILPSTLKNIGSTSNGSVFFGCSNMQFVRTAGGNPEIAFELPENLEVLGRQSFYKCTGLPENTTVIIPASVTHVGSEVFNYTPSITTITVKTDDASNYDGKAFSDSTNKYGVGNRLTVFNNSAAKNTFTPSGFTSYKNSLTYEFTLHYGDGENAVTEPKLYAQSVNVCKNADGSWAVNDAYEIPKAPSENAPVGYDCGWAYNGKILTAKTVLKPKGDDLYLDTDFVLQNPTIEFIVDGTVIETENTYPKLTLSNNKEHLIGVQVSHPLQTVDDADVEVKFEYKWTDIWKGGSEGPRMDEDGFGADSWGKPLGTNTITINGPTHERTNEREYSGEDYGSGYYLLEVYGYSHPVSGGSWTLFYKSANTGIGVADPDRTVNIAYMFDVITSAPAEIPVVSIEDISVEYGYEKAGFTAAVSELEGYIYTYQWYEADSEGQSKDGRKIEGAIDKNYSIPNGKDAGNYYYYLEITAKKTDNGDTVTTTIPVKMTVTPKIITVIPNEGQKKYFGQQDPIFQYTLSEDCNLEISGALERETGEEIGTYAFTMGTIATDNPNYELKFTEENFTFAIQEYKAEAIFSPEQPDGDDGWYSSSVTVTPPDGHSISIDGGKTWSTEPIILDEYDGDFEYLLRSDKEDATKGAVARNTKPLKIDTTVPLIGGIEDGKTYCAEVTFTVSDDNFAYVTVNDMKTADYTLYADGSTYVIIAFDLAGNQSLSYTVTVNNGHTFTNYISDKNADCTENGTETAICDFCDATNTRQDEDSAFGHNYGEPEFIWSDDGKTCAVTFICKNNNTHVARVDATVTSEIKIPANCTEMGSTIYNATVEFNGKVYTDSKVIIDIPALGHNYGDEYWLDENHHWKECVCGYITDRAEHTFGDWNVTKDATATEKGVKEHICSVCGYKETAEVPAIGVPEEPSTPESPDNSGDTNAPQTGDSSNIALWIAFMFVSGTLLVIAGVYKKKKRVR